MTIASSYDEKVKRVIREALRESFGGRIGFSPIVVLHAVDEFGDGDGSNYLRILIVHDSRDAPLDSRRTSSLIRRVRPKLAAMGIHEFPSPRFIGRAEWHRMYPKLKRLHPELVVETG